MLPFYIRTFLQIHSLGTFIISLGMNIEDELKKKTEWLNVDQSIEAIPHCAKNQGAP